jgi:hypothetical protein
MLTGDFQNISPSGTLTKQQMLELLRGVTLENHSIDDFQVVRPSGDTVAITYHLTEAWRAGDQAVCFNGFASSVWVEIDGSWRLVLHVETPAE